MTEDLVRKFIMRRSRSFVTVAGRGVFFVSFVFRTVYIPSFIKLYS